MIGSLGNFVFEVSADRVRTFDEMESSSSARLAVHETQGGKPLVEFLGPGLEDVSLKITLSAYHGLNPQEELEKMQKMRDEGQAVLYILDGKPQGKGYWLIGHLSAKYRYVDNRGRPGVVECSLSLKEYIPTWG